MKSIKRIAGVVLGLLVLWIAFQAACAKKPVTKAEAPLKVSRGDLAIKVVESGKVDAFKVVDVKSRAAGRISKLLVSDGDVVSKGQLLAIIDPQETELKVRQDRAQLAGAQSGVRRLDVEIAQRRVTAKAAYDRAISRLAQIKNENAVQPKLTRLSIDSAKIAYETAVDAKERLIQSTHKNERLEAQNALNEAEATLANAKAEADRQRMLLDRGYASRSEEENARLQYELARSRQVTAQDRLRVLASKQAQEVQAATERITQAKSDFERAVSAKINDPNKQRDLEQAMIAVQEAQAGLRDIDALIQSRAQSLSSVDQLNSILGDSLRQLGETEIRSPILGVVSKTLVQEGELVSSLSSFSSGTSVVKIEDRSSMLVKLAINEIDVARLRIGQVATIEVDAIPGSSFTGTVSKIAPTSTAAAASAATTTTNSAVVLYEVEVRLNAVDTLKTGMTAKCTMETQSAKQVIKVPLEYVGKDAKGSFVMLAPKSAKEKPTRRDVKVGLKTASHCEVSSGLTEGDQIVRPTYTGPKRAGMEFD